MTPQSPDPSPVPAEPSPVPTDAACAPPANDRLHRLFGERLRACRKQAKLSLAELADASGRSIGHLSQIERGISSPTIREVAQLAELLGVSFVDLLVPSAAAPEASPVRRDDDREFLPFRGSRITKRILSPRNAGSVDLFVMQLGPGATTGAQPYAHDGEEAGHVLEGSIELRIGDRVFTLGPGDSFRFQSRMPHAFAAIGERGARVLWVNIGHRRR